MPPENQDKGEGIMRRILAIVVVLVAAGCANEQTNQSVATNTSTPASAASSTAAATPKPDGKFDSSCDMNLNSDYNSATAGWLVADAELHNTGNVGLVIRVRAMFKQAGSQPITRTRTTRVAYHAGKAIHFKIPIDSNEADAFQSAPGYFDNQACAVHARIMSTFGAAH